MAKAGKYQALSLLVALIWIWLTPGTLALYTISAILVINILMELFN